MIKALKVIVFVCVCLCLGAAVEGESRAITLDLLGAGWNKPEVMILISEAEELTQQSVLDIRAAVGDWNEVLGEIDGAPILTVAENGERADLVIVIKSGDRYPLGQTLTRTVGRSSCVLRGAFIQLNGKALGQELSRAGMRSVARHELGHALGLRHSDDPDDLMYPFFDYQDLLEGYDVTISDYDREGIEAIYPREQHCPVADFLFWEE